MHLIGKPQRDLSVSAINWTLKSSCQSRDKDVLWEDETSVHLPRFGDRPAFPDRKIWQKRIRQPLLLY